MVWFSTAETSATVSYIKKMNALIINLLRLLGLIVRIMKDGKDAKSMCKNRSRKSPSAILDLLLSRISVSALRVTVAGTTSQLTEHELPET